jgi:hypothetical protein
MVTFVAAKSFDRPIHGQACRTGRLTSPKPSPARWTELQNSGKTPDKQRIQAIQLTQHPAYQRALISIKKAYSALQVFSKSSWHSLCNVIYLPGGASGNGEHPPGISFGFGDSARRWPHGRNQ